MTAAPRSRWETAAIWLCVLAALGMAGRLLFASDPARNNVYLKVFAPAADAFWARRDLYLEGSGFRYPPLVAALLWPFAACGPVLGSILWRALNFVVLLLGLRACNRAGLPAALTSGERALLLATTVLIGIGGLNNGQANALMLGCLLLAAVAALRGANVRAAGQIGVATALKVYPFAFGMVLATLRPRLWPWLVLTLVVVVAAPYALAPADYVSEQYRQLFEQLRHEDRTGDLGNAYRDLRLVLASIGVNTPPLLFLALQASGGLAIVLGARRLRRGIEDGPAAQAAAFGFATSATLCWMLLLGPSTEKVTYQLLTVPLVWQLVDARRAGSRARLLVLGAALLLAVVDVTPWATKTRVYADEMPWLRCFSPWAALLVALDLAAAAAAARGPRQTPSS
ncbi:MAG: DUF2029 domain-containing protein [Planctomycetes bacterium]|nr:DUF2029 domain-containing protein [Planctomycetota bacterium]MCB9886399.1 DUF2029 domain-containing protein [Planctomycetota bacterium]